MEELKKQFWVILIYNNPCRYKKRLQLFKEHVQRMIRYDVNVCIVELTYGNRPYDTLDLDVQLHIPLCTNSILWHKENMINIGIQHLPSNWNYVAWIDTDIDFVNKNWVEDTLHQLQHHSFVQLFSDYVDLGPKNEIMTTGKSFMYCYVNNLPPNMTSSSIHSDSNPSYSYYYSHDTTTLHNEKTTTIGSKIYWHPGYCWAATKQALNTTGGLYELSILGSGDHQMALCLIGKGHVSIPSKITRDYKTSVLNWQKRALRLHKNVGYVEGTIYHYFHGKKSDRRYNERWLVLEENKYQPSIDVHKDIQGILVLYEDNHKLRDDILMYFRQRNEDSIDL